jgi:hypothetical protein
MKAVSLPGKKMAVFGRFVDASRTVLIQRRGVEQLFMRWPHCIHRRDRRADAFTTGEEGLDMAKQSGYSVSKIMVIVGGVSGIGGDAES